MKSATLSRAMKRRYTTYTTASSITRHGITWTFDTQYQIGLFCNGDSYVIPNTPGGAVVISSVSPAPSGSVSDGTYRNGSKVNPSGGSVQWFDDRVTNGASVGETFPLNLYADQSLVSTASREEGCAFGGSAPQTYVLDAAVLTCLASAPAANSFRPAYSGSTKTIHSATGLNIAGLPSLAAVSSTPSLSTVQDRIERVWLDVKSGWVGRQTHPLNNMPDYGREIASYIGDAALMLLINPATIGDKSTLVYRMIQLGIDFYGISQNGGHWQADGGHCQGRKFPIVFAGYMLSNSAMRDIGTSVRFQEDDQTFAVGSADVAVVNDCEHAGFVQAATSTTITLAADHPATYEAYVKGNRIYITAGTGAGQMRVATAWNKVTKVATIDPPWTTTPIFGSSYEVRGYELDMVGNPAWGIKHISTPAEDNPSIYAPYIEINIPRWYGHAIAMLELGLAAYWGHDEFLDACDMYAAAIPPTSGTFRYEMWNTYR